MASPNAAADRYGNRRPLSPRSRLLLALAGVGVLVALTLAFFLWQRASGDQVDWTVIGYDVRSDSQVVVDFTVSKPDGTAVSCRVVAQDRTMTVVGSRDVDLPAAGSQVRRSVIVPTRSLAVLGTIDSCVRRRGSPAPGEG